MKEIITSEYELAYHLTPDLEAAAAEARVKDIEAIITGIGGSVLSVKDLKRMHLSYPLRHKHYGLFGTCRFSAPTTAINAIDSQLRIHIDVLRHLVVKDERVGKEKHVLGEHKASTRTRATHASAAPDAGKEKVAGEQIEKELADVIEKL